jgi:hypothetical protein
VRLNCQFDLMESGQSPDGLGRDSRHCRRPCRSLRLLERGLGHSGARQPPLESHPAPLMSRPPIRPEAGQED